MNARTVLSLVNLAAIAAAFVVLVELPQYADYAFYGLLGWIVVGFVLLYVPGIGRPSPLRAGGSGAALPSETAVGGAFPSPVAAPAPHALDFCIYCGADLPPGAPACPACRHRVASM